ncbi:hypothetical protein [Paracoccus aminophilus]|uniref:Tail assembly chaperone n=1 Tax=Paracoccus aminophilus JCM 7686 TaxID=1367847 RepID=S5YCS9_PARAH|nr:hypothetical protein [Paracoccus aminophilus]AGT09263.1 hypothetical protein JCM7686_2184 [Paracoccus aminophilus JCM 7686]
MLQPAHEVQLRLGDHAVTLRADLRAAAALEALPGGISATFTGILRGRFTEIRRVILATATDEAGAHSLLLSLSHKPLAPVLPEAQAACLDLMANLLPAPSDGPSDGPGMTWESVIAEFYGFATAYLDWPPSETWNASLQEIEAALIAKGERAKVENATPEERETKRQPLTPEQRRQMEEQGLDPDFDRMGLRELQAMF